MNINSVELLGTEANIEQLINQSKGKEIVFSNGCSLYLIDDDGVFWGTDPYGLDWACNVSQQWVQRVINWINFWNQNRDETGALIEC